MDSLMDMLRRAAVFIEGLPPLLSFGVQAVLVYVAFRVVRMLVHELIGIAVAIVVAVLLLAWVPSLTGSSLPAELSTLGQSVWSTLAELGSAATRQLR